MFSLFKDNMSHNIDVPKLHCQLSIHVPTYWHLPPSNTVYCSDFHAHLPIIFNCREVIIVWATLGSKVCNMENNGLGRCLNANINGHFVIAMWRISKRLSALSCNAVQLCVIYTCTWHRYDFSSNNCRLFLCICYEKHEPAPVIPLMTLAKLLKVNISLSPTSCIRKISPLTSTLINLYTNFLQHW